MPIIYVEDSAADAELFGRALLKLRPQSRLVHFRTAEAALGFCDQSLALGEPIEILVVDINLPGMDGRDFIRAVRSRSAASSIPIIALSGALAFKTVDEAEAIGAASFLLKPQDYYGWMDLVDHLQVYCGSLS